GSGGEEGAEGSKLLAVDGGKGVGLDGAAWEMAREEVEERLRDVYRVAWGVPWVRNTMANNPNAMMAFTPLDMDDGINQSSQEFGIGNHPAATDCLRKVSKRIWREYQGALSMGEINENKGEGEEDDGTIGKDRGTFRQIGGVGVLMLDVWGNQSWVLGNGKGKSGEGDDMNGDRSGGSEYHPKPLLTKRQEKLVKRALSSPSITALVVCSGTPLVAEPVVHPKVPDEDPDVKKEREKAAKKLKKDLKKQGKKGKAEIKRMEEEEKAPKLTFLSPAEVGPMNDFYEEKRPVFQWSYHSHTLQDLLEKIFDWASGVSVRVEGGGPARKTDVVFLCGGTRCGVRTVIEDHETTLSFTQLCVGPISDATIPCPWPLDTGALGDRITYTHHPLGQKQSPNGAKGGTMDPVLQIAGERGENEERPCHFPHRPSFGLVNILSEPLNAHIDPFLVHRGGGAYLLGNSLALAPPANHQEPVVESGQGNGAREGQEKGLGEQQSLKETVYGVNAILGPVVGKVGVSPQGRGVRERCHVPVLLEVDADGLVCCVLRDVLTSEEFGVERQLKARRPRAFWVQGLRPSRRYTIEFGGIDNKGDRKGHFTTPDSSFPDMVVAVVSNDKPGELPHEEPNLWSILGERLKEPWHGVELMLHVGGQVDLTSSFEDGALFLSELEKKKSIGKVSPEEEAEAILAVKERFREEYRRVWNQPSTREVLASCQHLMVWSQGEACKGYNRRGALASFGLAGRRLLRLAREVYREYQKQLWDLKWGAKFEFPSHEAYYTTCRWGTVGILSLDSREIIPEGDCIEMDGDGEPLTNSDNPVIGNAQWRLLKKTLDNEELVTLIVITELPLVWDDVISFSEKVKTLDDLGASPEKEDQWAYRPKQQRALLLRLFEWKNAVDGREVCLLAGAGEGVGCAAESRVDFKMRPRPTDQSAPPSTSGETRKIVKSDEEEEDEKRQKERMRPRPVGISQVVCGPTTGAPSDPNASGPAKGEVLVPLTEEQKEQERMRKREERERGRSGGLAGNEIDYADREPMKFVHVKTAERNYALLKVVIADRDEEGPVGLVESKIITSESADRDHPTTELMYPPKWWSSRYLGHPIALLDDAVYMKGREMEGTMAARLWLESSEDFKQATLRAYQDHHLADVRRPLELRTIQIDRPGVLAKHMNEAIRAVHKTIPQNVRAEMAHVPDSMILDFLLVKACPEVNKEALADETTWEGICRSVFLHAAYIRVAALWAEEAHIMRASVLEEEERKVKAKLRRKQERDLANAEKEAQEMVDLLSSDPNEYQRRLVIKRTEDADRRKAERLAKAAEEDKITSRATALAAKKEQDMKRLAREAKEKEAKEQDELNLLADTDPDEYDRRMKEFYKKKLAEAATAKTGVGDGDADRPGDLERRRSLARERRDARRAQLRKRPVIGIP
ncbi:unnamed protein product, partial [Discosporangium mesarthrocarpum]